MQLRSGVPSRVVRSRRKRLAFRVLLGLPLVLSSYSMTARSALPPDAEAVVPAALASAMPRAELHGAGIDETITGSVGTLFSASVFTGPNRSEKQARALPVRDPVAVASAFDVFRNGLLEMKMPHAIVAKADEVAPEAFVPTGSGAVAYTVASVAADPMTAAFAAIRDALRLDPVPTEIPGALAYARAAAPPSLLNSPISMRVSDKQDRCLAEAIYFEARDQSYRGQAAVAQVVLNRVKSNLYPSTICGVVYQNQSWRNACQFSFACDGIPERIAEPKAWETAKEIADKVLRGEIYLTEIANASHYHADYVNPSWSRELKRVTKIGEHIFYRFRWAKGTTPPSLPG